MLCNYMGKLENISSWNLLLLLFGFAFLESQRYGWEEIIWPEEVSATVSSAWLDEEVFG